jgi:hypothetical protein
MTNKGSQSGSLFRPNLVRMKASLLEHMAGKIPKETCMKMIGVYRKAL